MTISAFFLLLMTAFFWGIPAVFEKVALKTTDPMVGITIRSVFVSLILLTLTGFMGKWGTILNTPLRDKALFSLSGLLAGLLGMLTYYYALRVTPVSKAVPIAASYPIIAAVLGIIFLGEHLSWQRFIGIAFIITGVLFAKTG